MVRRSVVVVAMIVAAVATATPARADGIRDSQWHLGFLDVAAAHRYSQGTDVVVAVVDSGVDAIHPDLADNVLPPLDVTGAIEGAGRFDVDGRGTGLAGLIAGHGHGTGPQRADGVLGIAPRARVLPVAITTKPGQFGDPDVLADGIGAAVSRGAKVICVGRGLPASPRLERAVADALRADVVVVASLANRRGETFLPWPAAYPGVLAVIPLDRTGTPVAAASPAAPGPTPPPGPAATGLGVPGVDLVTTDAGSGYRIDAGTGAAAVAAGAAALVRARYPELRAEDVLRRLTATASRQTTLNLVAALTETVAAPTPTPTAAPTTAPPRSPAAQPTAAPGPAARAAGKAAFDTTDWHRWLVATPLLAFVGILVAYAVRGTRRRPAR